MDSCDIGQDALYASLTKPLAAFSFYIHRTNTRIVVFYRYLRVARVLPRFARDLSAFFDINRLLVLINGTGIAPLPLAREVDILTRHGIRMDKCQIKNTSVVGMDGQLVDGLASGNIPGFRGIVPVAVPSFRQIHLCADIRVAL